MLGNSLLLNCGEMCAAIGFPGPSVYEVCRTGWVPSVQMWDNQCGLELHSWENQSVMVPRRGSSLLPFQVNNKHNPAK